MAAETNATGQNQPTPRALAELESLRPVYLHDHPPVRNVNELASEGMTFGQRTADQFAVTMGSWRFIIIQSMLLVVWIGLNIIAFIHHWDPYPFILLNLVMSFQAAYAAPIIMMSQNRQALKDRLSAEHDFNINVKAEEEVKQILIHLRYQDELILSILAHLESRFSDGRLPAAQAPD